MVSEVEAPDADQGLVDAGVQRAAVYLLLLQSQPQRPMGYPSAMHVRLDQSF